ncbi:hypothetical protein HQ531_05920 [bacterium]|nr:hypothetical protein [bacterium]
MKTSKTQITETRELQAARMHLEIVEEQSNTASSLYLLLLEALGLEILNTSWIQPLKNPFYIRCSYEQVLKFNKQPRFNIERCGKNIWKIGIEGIDNNLSVEDPWISRTAKNGKEVHDNLAGYWIDMMIESSLGEGVKVENNG